MFNIGQYFKRIQSAGAKELLFRSIVCRVVKEIIGIEVPVESVSIRAGIVTIKNIPQSARSAVFIKKQKILDDINKNQDIYITRDIK